MKKIILTISVLITLTLTSCTSNQVKPSSLKEKYKIVIIDGCEYIMYSESHGYQGYGYLTHKGNCKNPIHIYHLDTIMPKK